MNDFQTIKLNITGGVANLTLNRPQAHNAMNRRMIAELSEAALLLKCDAGVRVVVLSGEGESFCAGGDLRWMQENMEKSRGERIRESADLGRMLTALSELPQLLIGRINGQAYGGGVGMIAVCDIVVAVDTVKLALTEVKLGLIPANISPFVVARIGRYAARRTFLNGRPIDASLALRIGLVDVIAAPRELDERVAEEIQLARLCAPGAVAATKKLVDFVAGHGGETVREYTARGLADAWESTEAQQGLRCFFAREKPPWTKV